MSEKRFVYEEEHFPIVLRQIKDNWTAKTYDLEECCDLLNEQQSTINELDQENADLLGDKIRSLDEFEKCTNKLKAKILEQHSTITELKEENEQLKYDNFMFKEVIKTFQKVAISERKKLEKENEHLRKELNDCEKFRYQFFKRMGELHNE